MGLSGNADLFMTGPLVVAGVSFWNRRAVAGLVRAIDPAPVMLARVDEAAVKAARQAGGTLVAWSSKLTQAIVARCAADGVPLVRIEDGFVRSVGLGAGLVSGAAYALDTRGIYYDATGPSDLEHLLQHALVSAEDAARGGRLRARIVAGRISKYNLAGRQASLPDAGGRERVLVPGQVAADAAIARTVSATVDVGALNVNLALLEAVRARNPDACIVYKPHPDVASGLRGGAIAAADVKRLADVVVADVDIVGLIDQCDRVETLSSLAGFEALMRGKPVTVHGMPFYAGWGLTEDLTSCARRTRKRTLDEVVVVALAQYCRYVDPETAEPISCERLIERLAMLRGSRRHRVMAAVLTRLSWIGRKIGV